MSNARDGLGQYTAQGVLAALAVAAVILAALGYFDRIAERWAGGPASVFDTRPATMAVPPAADPWPDPCGEARCVPTS